MTIDCHVHSDFSFDGHMSPDRACRAALASKSQLSGIAFTDHLDLDFPGYADSIRIDYDEYFKTLHAVKAKYDGRLTVLCGGEIGIQPHTIEKTTAIIKDYNFDFLIGSVHIIDHLDPIDLDYFVGRTLEESYARYLQELIYMISNFDHFDVLGHFDYITRYAPYEERMLTYHENSDLFDTLFSALIKKGKGIEINTGSYREITGSPAPPGFDADILRRYKELGGELICLGSDSHTPEYLGYNFKYFKDMLADIGFTHLVHFVQRAPVFVSITK